MDVNSKWVITDCTTDPILRINTLKPRLDYAIKTVDNVLDILGRKKIETNRNNLTAYSENVKNNSVRTELQNQIRKESEISFAIEALRQIHRCLDSVFGLGNIVPVLSPTISIVKTVRSSLNSENLEIDELLGDLSLVLGSLIVDSAHLCGGKIDFGEANIQSCQFLDKAKLIADSKICKQFPNLDIL